MTRLLAAAVFALPLALLAPAARADRLELSDGRVVEGSVTKDGEVYRVVSRFGEAEVPAKEVVRWEKAASVEAEWRRRASELKEGDTAGRAALAKWLADQGRAEEARGLAQGVVDDDPENALAHEVLGHIRHRGAWMSPDDAKRADGLVQHGGAWYTPEEWERLGAEARAKADAEEARLTGVRVQARLNEAVRLMLAPDAALRAEGQRRLVALSTETGNPAYADLVPRVQAYAAAADRMAAAAQDLSSGGSANVLAECRIQLARLKRPIKEFQTSLASNIGAAPVTLQLPEVEVIKLNTTVSIPAGR